MTTPASEATTIWRNARLATVARGAPGLGVVERGAIVARGGRIVFAGPEPDAPAAPSDARIDRLRRALDHAGADRLPHPSRLRRQPRGGIRGAPRRRELRGDRARGRRHRLDRPRDARGERGRARPPVAAASRRADRRGRHDGRDQVRLRPRSRDRAQDAAGRAPPRARSVRSRFVRPFSARTRCRRNMPRTAPAMSRKWPTRCCRRSPSEGLVDAVDGFCEGIAFSRDEIAPGLRARAEPRPSRQAARRAIVELRRRRACGRIRGAFRRTSRIRR